ncbi:MAG TPA: hypothetical protein VG964_03740, partial [Candidatus Saccharimonadales bacterium]|nr:hypothetical protein [Candidatus Saccharimonadales bacterium]
NSSALSASPDGKYAAYETQRSAGDKTPQLFILSTSDDRLLTFDSGDYNFSLIDWFGDTIVYKAIDNRTDIWQAGHEKLKSYNAATGKTTVLDSSAGTDSDKGAGETYDSVYLTSGKVVFDKWWNSDGTDDLSNHNNSVISVSPDGQNKQTAGSYSSNNARLVLYQYAPNSFYVEIYNFTDSNVYYDYTVGGNYKKISQPSNTDLYNNPLYYFSPDRNQTYWSEGRDGKDTLITADAYGSESSQKVQATGYEAAGWYTNKYLISTNKDQDELYVMALGGKKPVKVADYQSTYVY